MLNIVATPIGNLQDISLRALEVLKSSDAIICEDTRRSAKLLDAYGIKKPFIILNDYNESRQINSIIERLQDGQNLSLISDAGTPLISDPGFKLVRQCHISGIDIDSLPGPVSPIVALTLSSLPTDKFMFLGYLPDKSGHRISIYKKIQEIDQILKTTFIIFIAPFKLIKTLEEMQESLGDITVFLCAELTKIHQKSSTKKISLWIMDFKTKPPKGEWIMCLNLGMQNS